MMDRHVTSARISNAYVLAYCSTVGSRWCFYRSVLLLSIQSKPVRFPVRSLLFLQFSQLSFTTQFAFIFISNAFDISSSSFRSDVTADNYQRSFQLPQGTFSWHFDWVLHVPKSSEGQARWLTLLWRKRLIARWSLSVSRLYLRVYEVDIRTFPQSQKCVEQIPVASGISCLIPKKFPKFCVFVCFDQRPFLQLTNLCR
jgi:hypothetical protein